MNFNSEINWPLVKIDDIKSDNPNSITIGPFGSRMKSDCYVDSGIPVIRGSNLTSGRKLAGKFVYITEEKAKELSSSIVLKNDLVFPHRGAIGEVGIIMEDKRYILSSSLMKLACDLDKAHPLYLYYFFKSKQGRHELLKNASQVGTPGIGQPLTSLRNITLKLPEPDEQKKIANILSKIDDKIELNHQINQTLEEIAQAIFKSWFVDFDPVKAKIAAKGNGQNPDRAAMLAISGKSAEAFEQLSAEQKKSLAETAALFPDEMQGSELGEIPKGWDIKKVEDIVTRLKPSKRYTSKQVEPYGTIPVFEQGNSILLGFHNDKPGFNATPENPKFIFGDHTCITHLTTKPFDISQNVIPLTGKCFHTLWVFHAIKDKQVFQEYRRHWAEFIIHEIVTPNEELAYFYATKIRDMYDYIDQLEAENLTLTLLRDTLLPKLLSGEIELNNIEINNE